MKFSFSLLFEVLSFLFSVFFLIRKPKNKLLQYFVPFLMLTVIVEFMGWWWSYFGGGAYKNAMFNLFIPVEISFYSFLFLKHLHKHVFKTIIRVFIPLFLVLAICNILFLQGFNETFNSYTAVLGSFFIVLCCCLFFYESITPVQIDLQLSKQPFFWIVSGLLIFYLGSVIANALFEYLKNNDLHAESKRIYIIIFGSLNVILYSSFVIAFFICPNDRKTS